MLSVIRVHFFNLANESSGKFLNQKREEEEEEFRKTTTTVLAKKKTKPQHYSYIPSS